MQDLLSCIIFLLFAGIVVLLYRFTTRRLIVKLPPTIPKMRTPVQKIVYGIGEVIASIMASMVLLFIVIAMFAGSDSEPTIEVKITAVVCLIAIPVAMAAIHRAFHH